MLRNERQDHDAPETEEHLSLQVFAFFLSSSMPRLCLRVPLMLTLTQILPSLSSCVSLGIYGRGCVADTQTTNMVQADFSPTGMLQLLRNFVLSYLTCSCYCSNWCLWLHKATAKKYDFIYLKYLYARGCVLLQDVISFWLFCRAQAIVTQIISL